jgi:uncharacterized protein with NRDE domain
MCLIFLSINQHQNYKLIIAANRDEFYSRQTAAADYWKDHPTILGGRDLQAQGTWMAMSKSGKISMVTNYRDPKNSNPLAPSRGQLVSDFLLSDQSPQSYLQQVESKSHQYNGFNLVVGRGDQLYYHSNYKRGIDKLTPGLHGLSNHLLDTPWPKVERGKEKLKTLLSSDSISSAQLFHFLQDDLRALDSQLPETGIGIARERALSSMFIKTDGYGTRCSTVILINHENQVEFTERVYDLSTFVYTDKSFQLSIPA